MTSVAGLNADLRASSGEMLTGRKTIAPCDPLPRLSGLGEGCLCAQRTACVSSGADEVEGDDWREGILLRIFSRLRFFSNEPLDEDSPKDRRFFLVAGGGGLDANGLAMFAASVTTLFGCIGESGVLLFTSVLLIVSVLSKFRVVGLWLRELNTLNNLRGSLHLAGVA